MFGKDSNSAHILYLSSQNQQTVSPPLLREFKKVVIRIFFFLKPSVSEKTICIAAVDEKFVPRRGMWTAAYKRFKFFELTTLWNAVKK